MANGYPSGYFIGNPNQPQPRTAPQAQGVTNTQAPSDVNRDDLMGRFGDWLLGVNREQATAPFINLPQGVTPFQQRDFYKDLQQALTTGRAVAGQQQSLADIMAARARGEGQSIAEMQLQRTAEENQRRAAGAMAGIRGMNPALAQRLLLNQQSAIQQQASGQGAMLRAQEQLAAQQALGQQLSGMRAAESQLYGQAGQFGTGQAEFGAKLGEAAKGRELDIAKANQQSELERQRIQNQANQVYNQAAAESRQDIGEGISELGKQAAKAGLFYDGGVARFAHGGMAKAKIVKAHDAAKSALKAGSFKQYGDRAENVAYATMMKRAKENKLADGDWINEEIDKTIKESEEEGDPTILDTASDLFMGTHKTEEKNKKLRDINAKLKELSEYKKLRNKMEAEDIDRRALRSIERDKQDTIKAKQKEPIRMPAKYMRKDAKIQGVADGGLMALDNEENDTIPAMLSEGEAVIPRSIMAAKDAPIKAAKFIAALQESKSPKQAKKEAFNETGMKRLKDIEARLKMLEKVK